MTSTSKRSRKHLFQRLWRDHQLLVLLLPGLAYYLLFHYGPMYGLVIAFKRYSPFLGVAKSPWVGFKYFTQFMSSMDFGMLFRNTLTLGIESLLFVFPAGVVFALLLNEVRHAKLKKAFQTLSYLPHFLSVVVVCSIFIEFFSPSNGLVNRIIKATGNAPTHFIAKTEWYRFIYITSGIWANVGSNAIIYLAALAAIDPELYEAASIDGCTRFKMIRHITLPCITPTVVTMFLLSCGGIISIGADKTLLLYSPTTYSVADIFSTYVYRVGIERTNYSFSAAVGMFSSVIAAAVLLLCNAVSKRVLETSLW